MIHQPDGQSYTAPSLSAEDVCYGSLFYSICFSHDIYEKYPFFYWIRICYTIDTDDKEGAVQNA